MVESEYEGPRPWRLVSPVMAMPIYHVQLEVVLIAETRLSIYRSSLAHHGTEPQARASSTCDTHPNLTMELPKHILYFALCMASLAPPSQADTVPGLFEALKNAGASQFAIQLQSDPSILDMFVAGDIGTVFAPLDSTDLPKYLTRQQTNATDQQNTAFHLLNDTTTWKDMTDPPKRVLSTKDARANLGGQNQSMVTNTTNSTIPNTIKQLRSYGQPQPQSSLAQISTGLGAISNIIQKDIAFARCGSNGIIHIVDKPFTLPVNLSDTAAALPDLSTFSSLISCPCLKQELDWKSSVTVFIPSNEAFALAGVTGKLPGTSDTADRIKGLVVPGFVGYSPELVDGMKLTTLNGSELSVGVKDGGDELWIGGARVVKADVILFNGVAHIIDRVSFFFLCPRWMIVRG